MSISRPLTVSLLLLPLLVASLFVAVNPTPAQTQAVPGVHLYLFVSPDCPISNRYTSRYADLFRDYAGRGVAVSLVYSGGDPSFGDAAFAKWATARHLQAVPRVRDTTGTVAKSLHATTTPQAVVTTGENSIRYIGRVDDNADTERVTQRDARAALDAVLGGKPVAKPRTQAWGCAIDIPAPSAATPVPKAVTYARDVAPLLNKNCVSCHQDGDAAPFALDNYRSAKQWAAAIASYTANRKMPPFKADPHYGGPFADQRVLSESQIATLAAWHKAGAPSGDLRTAPKPPAPRVSGWELGTPDQVLSPVGAYRLDADGGDVYRDFAIGEAFTADTYVKAMEFAPGNRAVVHHMIVFVDLTGATCAEKDGKSADGQPGWQVSGAGSGVKDWDWGAGWAPGMNVAKLAPGLAIRVPKGARLVLQVHYHKSGKPETDLPKVALHFAKASEPITDVLHVAALGNPLIHLQPGVADNTVRAAMILPYDATVHHILPHMHYLGKTMTVTAKLPNGEIVPLVRINDWEFQWQMAYRYQTPVKLPKGTRLELVATYDNTADNPYQPNEPPKEVTFGEETTDEMCFAFIGLTRDRAPQAASVPRTASVP